MIARARKSLLVILTVVLMSLISIQSSAAVNMIEKAKSNTVSTGSFKTTAKGIRYRYKNGKYAKNVWLQINGKVYSFNKNGYVRKGWFTYKNNRYHANSKGVVYYGKWYKSGGHTWYLRRNGIKAAKCWIKLKGKYYRFNNWGYLICNKLFKVGSKTYYADANGVRAANKWVSIGEKKYYFNEKGVCTKILPATSSTEGGSESSAATDTSAHSQGKKFLFVGDSRTVGMKLSISDNSVSFIGEIGMGYSWLTGTADSQIRRYLRSNPEAYVIFNFGVNDLGNVSNYIAYYQRLIAAFPKAHFYFMSVNPIKEGASGYATNAMIKSFNKVLKAAFPSVYLDTFTLLTKKGFDTFDGIHYTVSTYQKIFNYVKSVLG